MANLTASELKKTISFHVANLSAADAVFLSSVISTFCDPNHNISADCLRTGRAFLAYGRSGKMQVIHQLDPQLTKN
jgi:hypothetical protein